MGWFDQFADMFNPAKSYRNAGKEIKKGYETGQGYLDPYNQAGKGQIDKLTGAENNLLNPGALENEWTSGYEMSPYAKQLQDQAKSSGMDAASSQGLLGSSSALNTIQQGSSNIMNADRQKYMDDLMQKYLSGIGIGQNMFQQGGSAAGQMGGNAIDFGKQMGSAKFGENNAMMNQLMAMMQMYQASKNNSAGAGGR